MELTELQTKFLLDNCKKIQDLNILTKKCFDDESLDGRSKQGRLVRKFLIENEIDFKTAFRPKQEQIKFTKEQKEFFDKMSSDEHFQPNPEKEDKSFFEKVKDMFS